MGADVVISGVGVVSPVGVGHEAFWAGLVEGRAGVSPMPDLETVPESYRHAGRVTDYRPKEILGSKGLRFLNDSARFLLGAAELAVRDAQLEVTEANAESIGIVVGTSFSNVGDSASFYQGILDTDGAFNPMNFPNIFINIPGGNLAIRLAVRALSTTLTNGATSALDAVQYAVAAVQNGRAESVLVGAVEVLSPTLVEGVWRSGVLGTTAVSRPFDRRREGIILGEGAGVVVLERAEAARARGARTYGRVVGYGSASVRGQGVTALADAIDGAMRGALTEAGADVTEVDYLSSGANSSIDGDLAEATAIKRVFGEEMSSIRVSSIKSMLGEADSASGVFQVAAALLAGGHGIVPATRNTEEEDPQCSLPFHVRGESVDHRVRVAMVTSFDASQAASLLVRTS